MTVSRSIAITYDAPDEMTAAWFEDFIERITFGRPWGTFADVNDAQRFLPALTNQALSAEPAIPSAEPLVQP